MSISYAILLDGGFVRRKLGRPDLSADASAICAFARKLKILPCVQGMRLHRVYYYDAKPLCGIARTPLGGPRIDFDGSAAAARSKRIQDVLQREPCFALRFGELVHEGWRLRPSVLHRPGPVIEVRAYDIQPSIRQKGVDMRIGLDIAGLTLKRQVQVIVLATADSDFIPAMKFARREGAQLFLVALGHGLKKEMHEHADLVIDRLSE